MNDIRATADERPPVLLVGADNPDLRLIKDVLCAHGFHVNNCHGTRRLLRESPPPVVTCCILGSHSAGGKTAPQIHAEMKRRGWKCPVIYVAAEWTSSTPCARAHGISFPSPMIRRNL